MSLVKNILITAAGVIVGLIIYNMGSKLLGLNSYEEDYETLPQ